MDNIEIIYDELKRNQIHIDKHALSFHINRILNQNKERSSPREQWKHKTPKELEK